MYVILKKQTNNNLFSSCHLSDIATKTQTQCLQNTEYNIYNESIHNNQHKKNTQTHVLMILNARDTGKVNSLLK